MRKFEIIQAGFTAVCCSTNMKIEAGENAAYDPFTDTIYKLCCIHPGDDRSALLNKSHPVHRYVEMSWWNWYDLNRELNPGLEEVYFGENPAISPTQTIEKTIDHLIDDASKNGKMIYLHEYDFNSVWQS